MYATVSFERFAAICAFLVALGAVLYAILFVAVLAALVIHPLVYSWLGSILWRAPAPAPAVAI
ncbi:MAG: hypothetical protein H0V45_04455 [Actinobacteria bacterium]|nr:hypothetical protein [Actinomycetota bacterium]